jgi:hypothetical protein
MLQYDGGRPSQKNCADRRGLFFAFLISVLGGAGGVQMPVFGSPGLISFLFFSAARWAVSGTSFILAAMVLLARSRGADTQMRRRSLCGVSQNDSSEQAVFLGQLVEEGSIYSQSSSRGSGKWRQLTTSK